MIDKELIRRKEQRFKALIDSIWEGDIVAVQNLIQESFQEDIDLINEKMPDFFMGKPIKTILEYALKSSTKHQKEITEIAEYFIQKGAKIDKDIAELIRTSFPTLVKYLS